MTTITMDGFPEGRLRSAVTHDSANDPWRRLLAAVVVRAVQDVHSDGSADAAESSAQRPRVSGRQARAGAVRDHIEVPQEVWTRARLLEQQGNRGGQHDHFAESPSTPVFTPSRSRSARPRRRRPDVCAVDSVVGVAPPTWGCSTRA